LQWVNTPHDAYNSRSGNRWSVWPKDRDGNCNNWI